MVLIILWRSTSQASGTDSLHEICQDDPAAIYLILQYLFHPAWCPQSFSLVSSKKSFTEMPLPFRSKANCCLAPLCAALCPSCLGRWQPPAGLLAEEYAVHGLDTRGLPSAAIAYRFTALG